MTVAYLVTQRDYGLCEHAFVALDRRIAEEFTAETLPGLGNDWVIEEIELRGMSSDSRYLEGD